MAKKKATPEPTPEPPQAEEAPLRLVWMSPAELAENPANWRRHPEQQVAALSDVIKEVGWAGACLLNSKTGRLIDGHARRKVALSQGCERVPVLVGSWSEADEAKILATLDPLASMAQADGKALAALLADVQTDSSAIQAMLDALRETPAAANGVPVEPTPPGEFPTYDESIPTEHVCPRCGYEWSGGESS